MSNLDYSSILICLEQKNVIVKDVYKITKDMEEEVQKEDVNLTMLINERQNRIDRIQKCNSMIDNFLKSLPESESVRLQGIISGEDIPFENEEERKIRDFVTDTKKVLSETMIIDNRVTEVLMEKREEARDMLAKIREEQTI